MQFKLNLGQLYDTAESHRSKQILVIELIAKHDGIYLANIINYDVDVLDELLSNKLDGTVVTIDKEVLELIQIKQCFEDNQNTQALLVCLQINEQLYHNFWLFNTTKQIFVDYIYKIICKHFINVAHN